MGTTYRYSSKNIFRERYFSWKPTLLEFQKSEPETRDKIKAEIIIKLEGSFWNISMKSGICKTRWHSRSLSYEHAITANQGPLLSKYYPVVLKENFVIVINSDPHMFAFHSKRLPLNILLDWNWLSLITTLLCALQDRCWLTIY